MNLQELLLISKPLDSQIVATRAILEENLQATEPYDVQICGLAFTVMPNVLSPKFFGSTEFLCRTTPFRVNDSFLEIGSGIGAVAVLAALNGADHVVAVDINPDAVRNTIINAARHRVADIVDCKLSDIFEAIDEGQKFGTIFWNIPFVSVDDSYVYGSMLERAIFDPGYRLTKRFVSESMKYLAPRGRILIGFGDFGDVDALSRFANDQGYQLTKLSSVKATEGNEVEFILYQLACPT
jgi:release factor glutamine methyltransferase